MIINKETMIEAIRELGHVRVDEVQGVILVRNFEFETTISITPVYTGNTITRVKTAVYIGLYYEHNHDEREYKTLNGLIDYIMKHIPLLQTEIYSCKNDRVAKNSFKQLIQHDIRENDLDYYIHDDAILVSTDIWHYSIKITVNQGVFNAEVKSFRGGSTLMVNNVRSFIDLQSLLHIKGVI